MKLTVKNDAVVTAKIDMDGFRKDFRKDFDLHKAIKNNLTIQERDEQIPEDKAVDMIIYFMNWGRIIAHMKNIPEMNIRICPVEYKDKLLYKPGVGTGTEFTFCEEKISGEMTIVINDIVNEINVTLKDWIDIGVPTYMFATTHKWTPLVKTRLDLGR